MTLLVSLYKVSKSFGSQKLFERLCFTLNEKDFLGLTGPNGAGKSTLLKIIAGIEEADEGQVSKRQGVKISYVRQFPEFPEKKIIDILLDEIPHVSEEEAMVAAAIALSKAKFVETDLIASQLSGGWKKRLDIVRAFMKKPDLVLLDEPTNHLDLEGIRWLEEFLKKEKVACLIVSHDRFFLQNVCNKIAEVNRCFPEGVFFSEGSWELFLERKKEFLMGQLEKQRSLSGTVREEVDWLRRSPKARTTKSKSRIQKAHDLIDELQDVRQRNTFQKADLQFSASERETRNLLVANNVSKTIGSKTLFKGVDLKLSPGSCLGIVGKNGTGKTTLLKILAGEISPDLGTIKYAQDLSLVYFDQHRETIDPNITLKEALSPHGDFVNFQGQDIHVNGWAKRFLFSPERLNLPVSCLSGGERARILMARLMLKPADILFLDEPTNDLDIPTLEVIEESLLEFPGAVLLITHDRYLMQKVCNQVVALGEGEYPSFYADYVQWESSQKVIKEKEFVEKSIVSFQKVVKKKLSYKEQKELESMESTISELERKLNLLTKKAQEESDVKKQLSIYEELALLQKKIDEFYERWQFLIDNSI